MPMASESQSDHSRAIQIPQSVTTTFLDQPPSCLQFCPTAPDYAVIGTYLLTETKKASTEDGHGSESGGFDIEQNKSGSLQLWKLDPVDCNL